MTYIRQFRLTAPPRANDSNPFTILNIRESATSGGTYTLIDSQAWTDSTPSSVTSVAVETTEATLEGGWYQFQWEDATGSVTQWWGPVRAGHEAGVGLVPSVDDVALLLRTRTVGDLAVGLGADTGPADFTGFTDETRPTSTEVERVIATAGDAVNAQLLGTVPEAQQAAIRHAVALYSAVLVESSFFREQSDKEQVTLWRELMAELIKGVNAVIVNTNPVAGSKGIGMIAISSDRTAPVDFADECGI